MKTKIIAFLFYFALFLSLVCLSYITIIQRKNLKRQIITHRAYTIGRVVQFYSTYGRMSGTTILKMECDINEEKVLARSSLILKNKYKDQKTAIGHSFMVIYDSLDTKKCILLFDYPVKDSADYFKYMKEFETKPPMLKDGGWFSSD